MTVPDDRGDPYNVRLDREPEEDLSHVQGAHIYLISLHVSFESMYI